jgi:nicotinate (nicotinamide) nucleotide adenylyltransferase
VNNKPIGIFGGTFDPVHYGHLRLAEEMLEQAGLGEIRFIPTGTPPHRDTPRVSARQRSEMVGLAIADQPAFVLDEREVARNTPCYTVDTLSELRAELGESQPLCLLMGGDAFLELHTWHEWERLFELAHIVIGLLAVSFVSFQILKERIYRAEGVFAPNHRIGVPCGIGAGITSTFAHGAGPVVSVFLIPQKLPKEIYVGTTVLVFTWINWIKMPFFIGGGIIRWETVRVSLVFLPLVPVGVWLGVWLNRKVSETLFLRLVYLFTFLTGVQLIFDFNLRHLF